MGGVVKSVTIGIFASNTQDMNILVGAHSGLRWIALILIVVAIANALVSRGKNKYEKKDKMINLFAMITMHTQLLVGMILYFISPKVNFIEGWMKSKPLRFFGMEHILLMVIAIVVITIGRKKAETETDLNKKHATIVKWFVIGLILLLAGIPWPFRNLGTGWI